jgi:archaellum component FlaC
MVEGISLGQLAGLTISWSVIIFLAVFFIGRIMLNRSKAAMESKIAEARVETGQAKTNSETNARVIQAYIAQNQNNAQLAAAIADMSKAWQEQQAQDRKRTQDTDEALVTLSGSLKDFVNAIGKSTAALTEQSEKLAERLESVAALNRSNVHQEVITTGEEVFRKVTEHTVETVQDATSAISSQLQKVEEHLTKIEVNLGEIKKELDLILAQSRTKPDPIAAPDAVRVPSLFSPSAPPPLTNPEPSAPPSPAAN